MSDLNKALQVSKTRPASFDIKTHKRRSRDLTLIRNIFRTARTSVLAYSSHSHGRDQGPGTGKYRPGESRKVPPPYHYHHEVVLKTMKDHLLFLLFTKSAGPGHCPPPRRGPGCDKKRVWSELWRQEGAAQRSTPSKLKLHVYTKFSDDWVCELRSVVDQQRKLEKEPTSFGRYHAVSFLVSYEKLRAIVCDNTNVNYSEN